MSGDMSPEEKYTILVDRQWKNMVLYTVITLFLLYFFHQADVPHELKVWMTLCHFIGSAYILYFLVEFFDPAVKKQLDAAGSRLADEKRSYGYILWGEIIFLFTCVATVLWVMPDLRDLFFPLLLWLWLCYVRLVGL